MMEYPKINTIWKRDEKTHKIMEGVLSCPEFDAIKKWTVTEKVDGTNIRVSYRPRLVEQFGLEAIEFRGKTDNAQLPPTLITRLRELFTPEKLKGVFPEDTSEVVLFGEGFGPKIQNGGRYRKSVDFVLFDVWIDDWWLEYPNVADIANKLGIPCVPLLGVFTLDEIVTMVRCGFTSLIAEDKTLVAEGIVATSQPMMMFRKYGAPIRLKLKVKDFAGEK